MFIVCILGSFLLAVSAKPLTCYGRLGIFCSLHQRLIQHRALV